MQLSAKWCTTTNWKKAKPADWHNSIWIILRMFKKLDGCIHLYCDTVFWNYTRLIWVLCSFVHLCMVFFLTINSYFITSLHEVCKASWLFLKTRFSQVTRLMACARQETSMPWFLQCQNFRVRQRMLKKTFSARTSNLGNNKIDV